MWSLLGVILGKIPSKLLLGIALTLTAACLALLFTLNSQGQALAEARAMTQIVRQERDEARREWQAWESLAGQRADQIIALRNANQAALNRERQAQADAQARDQILNQAQTRLRTEQENQEIIDEQTRSAVVSRLNRPL